MRTNQLELHFVSLFPCTSLPGRVYCGSVLGLSKLQKSGSVDPDESSCILGRSQVGIQLFRGFHRVFTKRRPLVAQAVAHLPGFPSRLAELVKQCSTLQSPKWNRSSLHIFPESPRTPPTMWRVGLQSSLKTTEVVMFALQSFGESSQKWTCPKNRGCPSSVRPAKRSGRRARAA